MRVKVVVPEKTRERVNEFLATEGLPFEADTCGAFRVRVATPETRKKCNLKVLTAGGWIACATALALARKNKISPKHLGKLLDFLDIKVKQCSLGLFK